MNRYRLRPQYQRRGKTKDGLNRMPFEGIVFEGSKVVETELDLSHWSGFLQEVEDEPAPAAAPKPTPAPPPELEPEPEPEPEPEAESTEAAASNESADDGKKVARTLSKTRRRRTTKSEGA